MSNDLRIRASSWHFTMSEEVSQAILDTRREYPLWAEPSDIIGALAAAGLATRVDGQRVTIVGDTDDSEWIDSEQVYWMLELLAPFSDEDSFVEVESEYGNEPSRWVLRDGKVVEVSPRITWPNPRDIGPHLHYRYRDGYNYGYEHTKPWTSVIGPTHPDDLLEN